MGLTRRAAWLVGTAALVAAAVGVGLRALPEVVRRVAVTQISKATGRIASIENIDLNLFTRRFAVKNLRLTERDGSETFLAFERLDGRLSLLPLLARDIRLADLRLAAPTIRLIRAGPSEFNYSDLAGPPARTEPANAPSRWSVTLDRVQLQHGRIFAEDRAMSPAADWSVTDLDIEAANLTTREGRSPGRAGLRARIGSTTLDVQASELRFTPFGATALVTLKDFDLPRVRPYLPADGPALVTAGVLGLAVTLDWKRDDAGTQRVTGRGDVALKGLALTQPGRSRPFVTVPRLAFRIREAEPLARDVTLASVDVEGLNLAAVRNDAGKLDLLPPPEPPPGTAVASGADAPVTTKPPFRLRVERLALTDATVALTDDAVSPRREWRVVLLNVEAAGLSTVPDDPPATLRAKAQIATRPGSRAPATLSIDSDSLRLSPATVTARVSLSGFDLAPIVPYVPASIPVIPSRGTLGVALNATVAQDDGGLRRALVSGEARLSDLALARRDAAEPFLALPGAAVKLTQADVVARALKLGSVDLTGMKLRAVRDAHGVIDLLALGAKPADPAVQAGTSRPGGEPARATGTTGAAPTTASPPAPAGAGSGWRLSVDRIALANGIVTFEDHAVSPNTSLTLADLAARVERATWPPAGPVAFAASGTMPGGGHTEVKGTATLDPFDAHLSLATRDAAIEPYGPYFPFAARFVGFLSGDTVSDIRVDHGQLRAISHGAASARDIEIREPGAPDPVTRTARMEIRGIDLSWPERIQVERVTLTRPEVLLERERDGTLNLRRLLTPRDAGGAADAARAADTMPGDSSTGGAPPKPGLLQTMALGFQEIVVEDGYARFLDRSTSPAFSEDLSKLALTIRGLSNTPGRQRTTMTLQALVGADAALDMRGELSGIGESLRADLVGELRDFPLSTTNPYADNYVSWIIERGQLATRFHYHVEGDRITADHNLKFGDLKVQQARASDEARKRIGLPLGLVVALLKDSRGDITFSLPLSGSLNDKTFSWGETIWAGIKQVIVKVLVSPFAAIGRMFRGGGDEPSAGPEVDPVRFVAGSSVVSPEMEQHLTHVGDFLRRSPYITLALAPVATAADAESVKEQALTADIQRFQRERQIGDFPAAVAAYFDEQQLPGPPPKTLEGQLDVLRERAPVSPKGITELLERRLDATREALTRREGIPPERLRAAAPQRELDKPGEGRVELSLVDD